MPYLLRQISLETAEENMATLIAADVPAQLKYNPGDGSGNDKYAICVETEEFGEAQRVLGLDREIPEDEHLDDPRESDSVIECPRCGMRKINYPDEPFLRIVFVSMFFFMLPALGWMIWKSRRGTKKACLSCKHTWRNKP